MRYWIFKSMPSSIVRSLLQVTGCGYSVVVQDSAILMHMFSCCSRSLCVIIFCSCHFEMTEFVEKQRKRGEDPAPSETILLLLIYWYESGEMSPSSPPQWHTHNAKGKWPSEGLCSLNNGSSCCNGLSVETTTEVHVVLPWPWLLLAMEICVTCNAVS